MWESISWVHPSSPPGPFGWSYRTDPLILQRPPRALSQSTAPAPFVAKMQSSEERGKISTWEFSTSAPEAQEVSRQTGSFSSKGKVLVHTRGSSVRLKGVRLPGALLCPSEGRGTGRERWGFLRLSRPWPGLAEVCLVTSLGEKEMMGQSHKQEVLSTAFSLFFSGSAPHFPPGLSFYTRHKTKKN